MSTALQNTTLLKVVISLIGSFGIYLLTAGFAWRFKTFVLKSIAFVSLGIPCLAFFLWAVFKVGQATFLDGVPEIA